VHDHHQQHEAANDEKLQAQVHGNGFVGQPALSRMSRLNAIRSTEVAWVSLGSDVERLDFA
jgi:hypothetical protein